VFRAKSQPLRPSSSFKQEKKRGEQNAKKKPQRKQKKVEVPLHDMQRQYGKLKQQKNKKPGKAERNRHRTEPAPSTPHPKIPANGIEKMGFREGCYRKAGRFGHAVIWRGEGGEHT
jgi:hypothetical protein